MDVPSIRFQIRLPLWLSMKKAMTYPLRVVVVFGGLPLVVLARNAGPALADERVLA